MKKVLLVMILGVFLIGSGESYSTFSHGTTEGFQGTVIGLACGTAFVGILGLGHCAFNYCRKRYRNYRNEQYSQPDEDATQSIVVPISSEYGTAKSPFKPDEDFHNVPI